MHKAEAMQCHKDNIGHQNKTLSGMTGTVTGISYALECTADLVEEESQEGFFFFFFKKNCSTDFHLMVRKAFPD